VIKKNHFLSILNVTKYNVKKKYYESITFVSKYLFLKMMKEDKDLS